MALRGTDPIVTWLMHPPNPRNVLARCNLGHLSEGIPETAGGAVEHGWLVPCRCGGERARVVAPPELLASYELGGLTAALNTLAHLADP